MGRGIWLLALPLSPKRKVAPAVAKQRKIALHLTLAEARRMRDLINGELKCWGMDEPEFWTMLQLARAIYTATGCNPEFEPVTLVGNDQPAA